jgi:membrane protein
MSTNLDTKRYINKLDRARRYVTRTIWELEPSGVGRMRRILVHQLRLGFLVVEGFIRNQLPLRAAALTYATVFAIVPLFAVGFSLFKAFGGMQMVEVRIKKFILANLSTGSGETVWKAVEESVNRVHTGTVGAVGLVALILTAILLISNIEKSLNAIWGVRRSRNMFQKFTAFWTIVTVGPVLIGASATMTAALENRVFAAKLLKLGAVSWVLSNVLPFVFILIAFTCIYAFLPNTKVSIKAAFKGAFIAGFMWEFTKMAYVFYNSEMISAYKIYGSIGAIPIFLLWLYLSWMIFLLGAEISFAYQNVKHYRGEIIAGNASHAFKESLAVRMVIMISDGFLKGRPPISAAEIGERFDVPIRLVNGILYQLVRKDILIEVVAGSEASYQPRGDLANVTMKDVVKALREYGDSPPVQAPMGPAAVGVMNVMNCAEGCYFDKLGEKSLRDLLLEGDAQKDCACGGKDGNAHGADMMVVKKDEAEGKKG